MSAFEDFLAERRPAVEAALSEWVPGQDRGGDLGAAMRHIVGAGGKRFRPALVLLACEHCGGDRHAALPAACAVELVHAYSLVHDDLPCMDDAQLRRGQPCVHVVWGEAMGVLAGDGLLTLAFELLARHTPADRPLGAMITALAEAAGWQGMVGGQVADLAGEGAAPELARVAAIHSGKTAAMIGVSLRLGALAAGAPAATAATLAGLGHDLGLAFQIVDDLLDLNGSEADLGKPAGTDAIHGKLTWPAAVGREAALRDARALVTAALERVPPGRCPEVFAALDRVLLERLS